MTYTTAGAKLLHAAADVMEQRGHAKGSLVVTDEATATRRGFPVGSVCAIGAIFVAAGVSVSKTGDFIYENISENTWCIVSGAQTLLQREIGGVSYASIAAWNNNPDRSGSEVIAKMREVADKYTKTSTKTST